MKKAATPPIGADVLASSNGFHCASRVMILTGSSGSAFFIQETLLEKGLAQRVDIVHSVAEVEQQIQEHGDYHLLIVDLAERWQAGMQIGYEWQQIGKPLRLFLLPPGATLPQLELPNLVRTRPETLAEFVTLMYELYQQYGGSEHLTFYEGSSGT